MSLGQAIAHLESMLILQSGTEGMPLPAAAGSYVRALRDQIDTIKSSPAEARRILAAIPARACSTVPAFLTDNARYFIAQLLVRPHAARFDKECDRLFTHLNDCYSCFEAYCQIMRDYFHKTSELSKSE